MYTDPESREFLETVKRGEIPAEIRRQIQGTEARLDMEDHRHETYVPPKVKVKVFAGKGHMLGRYMFLHICILFLIYILHALINLQSFSSNSWYDNTSRSC